MLWNVVRCGERGLSLGDGARALSFGGGGVRDVRKVDDEEGFVRLFRRVAVDGG